MANSLRTAKLTREQVFELINGERDYQESLGADRIEVTVPAEPYRRPSVAEELVMMNTYLQAAMAAWTNNPGDEAACDVIRKITGMGVRCMENHGASPRQPRKSA